MMWLALMVPVLLVLTIAAWLADTAWAARLAERLDRYLR